MIARRLLGIFNVLFIGFLLAPVVVVVLVAFTPEGWLKIPTTSFSLRWFRAIGEHPEFISAFRNSLGIAVSASILATVVGTLAALGIVRYRFPGRDVVGSFLLSPLMVPTVVTGVALLYFFSRIGLASTLGGHHRGSRRGHRALRRPDREREPGRLRSEPGAGGHDPRRRPLCRPSGA